MPNSEIAALLGRTIYGIKHQLTIIFNKTGMSNRTELALWYVHHMRLKEQP